VVEAEPLEVRTVARTVHVEQRHHEPRLVAIAADTTRRLDVLGARLRLPEHHHQAEAGMSRPTEIMLVASATST
jgi:hypothetical protein